MAFRQQQRPRSSRPLSRHAPEPVADTTTAQQPSQPLEASEEWILFPPTAPSTTARTQTTSTERTPRTAGLSRFSEFGSLDTAAQSDHDGDNGTFLGTDEELDSLDDGLRAFHEPSDYGAPSRLLESGETVLPTHDGLGEFLPDATIQEHMWQFEHPRRRAARRRSSVQRHFSILEEGEEGNLEQERRQRIEKWRLEQSKALLEEIEKETRRRRRMSTISAARSRVGGTQQEASTSVPRPPPSVVDARSESSDEGTENLSLWQRITRRVIRDLIGLDEDTLSVIFGETLPEEASTPKPGSPVSFSADKALGDAGVDLPTTSEDDWQTRLLERVARELGILVHQLSEHPGAFSTHLRTQSAPDYAALPPTTLNFSNPTNIASSRPISSQPINETPASTHFAPTFQAQQTSHTYSEASLWGIEEEPAEADPLDTFRAPPAPAANIAEDLVREREYWEREPDVKMIFNFLVKRFTSRRSSISSPPRMAPGTPPTSATDTDEGVNSARRAAIIRQHHPLVSRTTGRGLPTSSSSQPREMKRKDPTYRTYYNPSASLRHQKLRSNSSCASQSTKKSKRSSNSARNYWDLGGSVGSGSVLAGEL
ncbi:hypothetical protein BDU57DRAFT_512404 [Ampelomyces quisqualis]|uniref:Uncharacterized protein n=1 Tax=Ampelomyces quisqualis TaxID=50730 RepID=A0A6A5QVA6_AMPQU|nr:hypothetical protein BDU57DRAFT_512404 [Ampelomyces quisqualis]